MSEGIQVKLCGVTSLVDAEFADRCGVDYLGINVYPGSPRYVSRAQYEAMAGSLPPRRRVVVAVEPKVEELRGHDALGFDRFQVHFRLETAPDLLAAWSDAVGPDRLWLAPKLPPGTPFPETLLPLAHTFLLDGYKADKFGGTGRTSDWELFQRLQKDHPDKRWILSGGLSPDNVGPALAATGARFVDVNSGVESAPGVKDPEKLKAFVARVHESRAAAGR